MAILYQPSLIPAFDTDGRLISGAELHFFLTRSVRRATVYTSAEETSAHTNPVVADAAGRFPPVYLKESMVHRVRLTDAQGVLMPMADVDPINVYDPLGPVVNYYRFGGFAILPPLAGECLVDHVATDSFTLPTDLLGSVVSVGTAPQSPFVLTVQQNGVGVGTITIPTTGLPAFLTAGRVPVPVDVGDVVSVIAPGTADPSIARLRFTLKGTC